MIFLVTLCDDALQEKCIERYIYSRVRYGESKAIQSVYNRSL